jgi:hypothetical protein
MPEIRTRAQTQTRKYQYVEGVSITPAIVNVPLAYCLACKRVVHPILSRLNRQGLGRDLFAHEHPLAFIRLMEVRGRREVIPSGDFPKELVEIARNAWVRERRSPSEIERLLEG